MNDQHLSPALYARSEVQDPDEAHAVEEALKDTDPCPPLDEEDSPESDGRPIEYPHLHRQVDD